LLLALFMFGAGLAHFAFPRPYQRIVPRLLGDPAFWVRWSGVAEIVSGMLLLEGRTRRVGALATMGVLLAVFPANIQMALDAGTPGQPLSFASPTVATARLPLQVPLIIWAWRVAGVAAHRRSSSGG